MAVLVVSLSGPLTACTTITKYEPLIYTVEVPEALRNCSPLPQRPTGDYTQRDVAAFIKRLEAARKDCKMKLKELGNLVDRYNANAQSMKDDFDDKHK